MVSPTMLCRLQCAKARRSNAVVYMGSPNALALPPQLATPAATLTTTGGEVTPSPNPVVQVDANGTTIPTPLAALGTLAPVPTPREAELNETLQEALLVMDAEGRPENTSVAMEPKKEEWMQYCDALYPHDPLRHIVTGNKAWRFMCYQMFREQKQQGGKKPKEDDASLVFFDLANYNRVMNQFEKVGGAITNFPTPTKPVGPSVFTAYRAALKQLFHEQQARYGAALTRVWEEVWLPDRFKKLQDHVKLRNPKLKKANYEEKVDNAFAPYAIVEHYDQIEQQLFNTGISATNRRCAGTALRHRFSCLYLTSGILCCESAYNAELSDFQGIHVTQNESDVHPVYIMIMQIPIGKTNRGAVRWGPAMRHKDVKLCCIGALVMYLMYRFYYSSQFEDFTIDDWCDNKKWFDIKLLVDIASMDKCTKMQNDSYSDKIKEVLTSLGLSCSKLCHLGRNLGAKILDLLEEFKEEKKSMGQWSPDVVDSSYSSKLPMRPMRKLAGYTTNTPIYYNPRTVIQVPESLLQATPMGSWCYKALTGVQERERETNTTHPTAISFLKFCCYINQVFLQDCAAMLIDDPDRDQHPMFKDIPVLCTAEFSKFKEDVSVLLANEKNPLDANIETVLPGLYQWHNINQASMRRVEQGMLDLSDCVNTNVEEICNEIAEERRLGMERLALAFRRMASVYSAASMDSNSNLDACMLDAAEEAAEDMVTKELTYAQEQSGAPAVTPGTSPACSPVTTGFPSSLGSPSEASFGEYHMHPKHPSLQSLYDKWHGLNKFADEYGGVIGRENRFGKKWRKVVVNPQQFSRHKGIIGGIQELAKQSNCTDLQAVVWLEKEFANHKLSAATFVKLHERSGSREKESSSC